MWGSIFVKKKDHMTSFLWQKWSPAFRRCTICSWCACTFQVLRYNPTNIEKNWKDMIKTNKNTKNCLIIHTYHLIFFYYRCARSYPSTWKVHARPERMVHLWNARLHFCQRKGSHDYISSHRTKTRLLCQRCLQHCSTIRSPKQLFKLDF